MHEALSYTIHSSSHSIPPHLPQNILVNQPKVLDSRWSTHSSLSTSSDASMMKLRSTTNSHENMFFSSQQQQQQQQHYSIIDSQQHQQQFCGNNDIIQGLQQHHETPPSAEEKFIIIKLEHASIVHSISFGKYHKELRDDTKTETFPLKYVLRTPEYGTLFLTVRYLKIEAISTWSLHHFPSIWYVGVSGEGPGPYSVVPDVENVIKMFFEAEKMKCFLDHLRRSNETRLFGEVLSVCKSRFSLLSKNWMMEHPILSDLYTELVVNGNFVKCEQLIDKARSNGLFEWYHATQLKYSCSWTYVPKVGETPEMRGGHQLCLDSQNGDHVYLIGGWNGTKDLSDFWQFDLRSQSWKCISSDTQKDGGPAALSCHKMVYDSKRNRIYVFGRYTDSTACPAPFYCYDFPTGIWVKLSDDTSLDGGPPVLYDHQMVIDSDCSNIYILGGRTFSSGKASPGLYVYDIENQKWTKKQIVSDNVDNNAIKSIACSLEDRYAHSMCTLNDKSIYIFGGVHQKDHVRELHHFRYCQNTIDQVSMFDLQREVEESSPYDIPNNITNSAVFHQSMSANSSRKELFILGNGWMTTPLVESQGVSFNSNYNSRNDLWVYDITNDQWNHISTLLQRTSDVTKIDQTPLPRFGTHFVYSEKHDVHILFGGNAGDLLPPNERLDDLWLFRCSKPTIDESVVRLSKLLLRQRSFLEQCTLMSNLESIKYIRSNITPLINNDRPEEQALLQNLISLIMYDKESRDFSSQQGNRLLCFDELCKFWNPNYFAQKNSARMNRPLSFE